MTPTTLPGADETMLVVGRFAVDTRDRDGRRPVVAIVRIADEVAREYPVGELTLADHDAEADPDGPVVECHYVSGLDNNVTGWRETVGNGVTPGTAAANFRLEWGVAPTTYGFAANRLAYHAYAPGLDTYHDVDEQ